MRRTQKRQHNPIESSDEDKPKKKKSPEVNLQLSEDSSSDSDIGTYLTSPSKLDLDSSFFNTIKTPEKDEKIAQEDADLGRLSDSESSDEELKNSNNNSNHNENKEDLNEIPSTSTTYNFEHISSFNQKLEEAKKLIEIYKAKKANEVKNDVEDMDVDDILCNEEKAFYNSLGSSEFEALSDDENKSDWEEVEDKEDESLVRKEGVEITIDLPGNVKKKKSLDLMAAIKRRINRKKKEHQVLVHKVHLLCWIGHGFYVNNVLNNQNLLAVALSLLPSKHCFPTNRVDLSYLENITGWYKKMMINKNSKTEINEPLDKILEEQILKKEAINNKMFVYIFICILRSLGIKCRLILSLQTEPLRPPQSELCSLSNKSNKEPENSGDKKVESTKKKKITKTVTFNLNRSYKGDKSFNTSLKHFEKKILKLPASKKPLEKAGTSKEKHNQGGQSDTKNENNETQLRRSIRNSSKSPATIQETKKNVGKNTKENESERKPSKGVGNKPKNEDEPKRNDKDDSKTKSSRTDSKSRQSQNKNEIKTEKLTSGYKSDHKRSSRKSSKSPGVKPKNVEDDKDKTKRNDKLIVDDSNTKNTTSNSSELKIRRSTRNSSKSPVVDHENENNFNEIQIDTETLKKSEETDKKGTQKVKNRTSKSPVNTRNEKEIEKLTISHEVKRTRSSTSPIVNDHKIKYDLNEIETNTERFEKSDETNKTRNLKKRSSKSPINPGNDEKIEKTISGENMNLKQIGHKNEDNLNEIQTDSSETQKKSAETNKIETQKVKKRSSESPANPGNEGDIEKFTICHDNIKLKLSPVVNDHKIGDNLNEIQTDPEIFKNSDESNKTRNLRKRSSKSPVNPENNEKNNHKSEDNLNEIQIDTKTRTLRTRRSKSPVVNDHKIEDNLNEIQIDTKTRTLRTRRSKSPVNKEKIEKLTKSSKSVVANYQKNDDNLNEKQTATETIQNSDETNKTRTLRIRKSKSPVTKPENDTKVTKKLTDIDNFKKRRSSKTSVNPGTDLKLQVDSKTSTKNDIKIVPQRKVKKELLKIKLPIPTRLRNLNNIPVAENKEESDDENNKIKFIPPVLNVKEEPPNSPEYSSVGMNEDEGFHGFDNSQIPEVIKKSLDISENEGFRGFTSQIVRKLSNSPDIFNEDDGFSRVTPQLVKKSSDFPDIPNKDEDSQGFNTSQTPHLVQKSSNSPDIPNEDEEFRGFTPKLIKKAAYSPENPNDHEEFRRFTPQLLKTSPNTSSNNEYEGEFSGSQIPQFDGGADTPPKPNLAKLKTSEDKCLNMNKNGGSKQIQSNFLDISNEDKLSFSGSQIPQLDGGGDTPPKTKKKPNLAKLKSSSGDKCPKMHLNRLKVPTTSKQIDSEDEFQPSCSSITKTSPLKRIRSVFSTSSPGSDKSRFFDGSPPKKSKQLDVRNDIVALVKNTLTQEKQSNLRKLMKRKKTSSDEDSDFLPGKISSVSSINETTTKVKRRIPMKKDLVEIEKKKVEAKEQLKKSKGVNVWVEVFAEAEEKWISVDVIKGQVHCVKEIYSRASHPVSYILGFDNDNHVKDITKRYCENWNTVTRKLRIDSSWWDKTLLPYKAPKNAREREEDEDLARQQLDQPLPKTISEYKNHPLYVLKRHLLKFEAIYPPDALTIGFVRNEPVYARDCVYTLHSREIWLKDAKVVKLGETPYKIVKARPKYDKLSNTMITDQMLEIFGIWQVEEYVPPTAENGIVPKNAYGNVDLFKPRMLPKGTVHLQFSGLNKVARKLNIDCPPAVTGFDFHSGFSHPVFDGFVVCEEFSEQLITAWIQEQEEYEKKEKEKNEKRIYDNWKKLIKGLLIRERLKRRYDFGGSSQSKENNSKDSKKKDS